MKFPLCPEICKECRDGAHIMHIVSELGDLCAHRMDSLDTNGKPRILGNGKTYKIVKIEGWAEDELFLEDLLGMVWVEYGRLHPEKKTPPQVPSTER